MSEPPTSAKPDADDAPAAADAPTFAADAEPVTDPLALTLGAGGPLELPEPVLGVDEDDDALAPGAMVEGSERPPFLADGLPHGDTPDAAADAPAFAETEIVDETETDAAAEGADDAVTAVSAENTAASRRVWRELRYAAVAHEKPVVVVPEPVIDQDGRLIRKYLFERSFDPVEEEPQPEEPDPEALIEALPPEPVELVIEEPPPPTFSEAELAAARAAGYSEGEAVGHDTAARATETRIVELIQQLGASVPGLAADRDQAIAAVSQEAARLAHAMVRRLMPELARRYRVEEIEGVVVDSLNKALDQPRIVIRTPADVTAYLSERLETVARQHGFSGRVIVLSDKSLGPSDVKVEWGDGGAERCIQRAWNDIDAIVARVIEKLEQVAPVAEIPPGASEDTIGSAA